MGGTYHPGELKVIGDFMPSGNTGKVKGAESLFSKFGERQFHGSTFCSGLKYLDMIFDLFCPRDAF
jgi:hypothetical protein